MKCGLLSARPESHACLRSSLPFSLQHGAHELRVPHAGYVDKEHHHHQRESSSAALHGTSSDSSLERSASEALLSAAILFSAEQTGKQQRRCRRAECDAPNARLQRNSGGSSPHIFSNEVNLQRQQQQLLLPFSPSASSLQPIGLQQGDAAKSEGSPTRSFMSRHSNQNGTGGVERRRSRLRPHQPAYPTMREEHHLERHQLGVTSPFSQEQPEQTTFLMNNKSTNIDFSGLSLNPPNSVPRHHSSLEQQPFFPCLTNQEQLEQHVDNRCSGDSWCQAGASFPSCAKSGQAKQKREMSLKRNSPPSIHQPNSVRCPPEINFTTNNNDRFEFYLHMPNAGLPPSRVRNAEGNPKHRSPSYTDGYSIDELRGNGQPQCQHALVGGSGSTSSGMTSSETAASINYQERTNSNDINVDRPANTGVAQQKEDKSPVSCILPNSEGFATAEFCGNLPINFLSGPRSPQNSSLSQGNLQYRKNNPAAPLYQPSAHSPDTNGGHDDLLSTINTLSLLGKNQAVMRLPCCGAQLPPRSEGSVDQQEQQSMYAGDANERSSDGVTDNNNCKRECLCTCCIGKALRIFMGKNESNSKFLGMHVFFTSL